MAENKKKVNGRVPAAPERIGADGILPQSSLPRKLALNSAIHCDLDLTNRVIYSPNL
jgi:hypothetical protein